MGIFCFITLLVFYRKVRKGLFIEVFTVVFSKLARLCVITLRALVNPYVFLGKIFKRKERKGFFIGMFAVVFSK